MLALDHIVIAGRNAEEDSITYNKRFAVKAVKGGEHENWGTYNYLAYFSNQAYIEWLGINNYDKAMKSDNPLITHLVYMLDQNETGPFQFALRTDQMDDYVQHFKENNIPFDGPYPGKRLRPDGTLLSWRMLFPKYDITEGMLPFLIEWHNPTGGPCTQSISNPQVITKINYSGVDKATFTNLYQLKNKRSITNQFTLQNSKISFNNNGKLSFELV
ncbi:VOC family protein [Paucisalibacillus sp. EB02]|uniref:VOC family protein n=1 Tax=Paucisalibacillus sp. EB02 TaxID=1347087 RepID=UPI0004B88986|nr:VOC family protein [Paucisalibacillus sp. EB02]